MVKGGKILQNDLEIRSHRNSLGAAVVDRFNPFDSCLEEDSSTGSATNLLSQL